MQFSKENATFFQNTFNFYIGNIDVEETVLFNDSFIVIGNIKTTKNIFAMGELIVIGDIESKSIYTCKDFLCIGEIKSDSIEVDGKFKTLDKEVLGVINETEMIKEIVKLNSEDTEYKAEKNMNSDDVVNEYTNGPINIDNTKNKEDNYKEYIKLDNTEGVENEKGTIDYSIYKNYISKKGSLIEGKIIDVTKDKILVNIDECINGYLIKRLASNNVQNLEVGKKINAYIKSVDFVDEVLNIEIYEDNESFIRKVIYKELEKSKYNLKEIFIKNITIDKNQNYLVTIHTNYNTSENLEMIEKNIEKYLNGKSIKLKLYEHNSSKNNENDIEKNKNGKSIYGLNIGDYINHKKFGEGIITGIESYNTFTINFNCGEKKISLDFMLRNGLISK